MIRECFERRGWLFLILLSTLSATTHAAPPAAERLIGHWPLSTDAEDRSPNELHAVNNGVEFVEVDGRKAAKFDGGDAHLEIKPSEKLLTGTGDFTLAVQVHTAEKLTDVLGDIASRFDPETRRGFSLGLMNYAGVTSAQSNYRHLQFGIDAETAAEEWIDCGRPGAAVYICALAVCEGELYAGTFETGGNETGHVWRYAGGRQWVDCGSPDRSNAVLSLAVYNGELYAGTARYKAGGSALADSPNETPGGRVYRYAGEQRWIDCGRLGEANDVMAMAVYDGDLYAIPLYSQGLFRYEGGTTWADCGTPGVRMMALTVFNGHLLGAGNEGKERGGVHRYLGDKKWDIAGYQQGVTQVYAFAAHEGKLYTGTWPDGKVFRDDGAPDWLDVGRLGEELEVMGMAVYNGKLYGGTLPLAEVYRFDGDKHWTNTGQLDRTPDVKYRRAWSMAVYQGKLFCGTLPSGHVHALQAGRSVTHDRELPAGWHHVAAVREANRLMLFVDGNLVATSGEFSPADYDLDNKRSLFVGFGPHDYFQGHLRELRFYGRALSTDEIAALAAER
ncbi:MAG: LamG domain-containing protein [Pirellulales bacterium]|nr:LamG domain-containing protein [Pirellulales bacterium]